MSGSLFSLRVVLRIIAVLSVVMMFVFTAENSVMISKGNEKIQANQLETLTKLLISQASLTASRFLVDQDEEKLKSLTNQLAHDRLVFDATIYDAEGVQIAASDSALSVRDVLGLDTPLKTASIGRQQLVEPVLHDNNVIGFIRITFETGKVTAISDHHYRKSDRYMYLMILASFTSGILLTLLLRRQKRRARQGENLLLKNAG
ncbi:YtjB family periplasmic protein [Vibrio rhizosphaerae]|uniref:YtjB family periplasmic protein n=1 Tax=Vibrio rhizosphaerae TaxID=398736 RepID=A0ABU4IYA9_9VIBR|nr:YtjB family periplasmic protein [Vibrio rhizosphaerae]MDW6093696.1 YtjB family periplasmic protein [Vibrio rhizosphaerae]